MSFSVGTSPHDQHTVDKTTVQNVHEINNDSLDEFLQRHEWVLLIFYHPLVPRWQRFLPVLEQTAHTLQNMGVAFAKLDCAGNQYITKRYPIQTYPYVVLCRGSDDFQIYKGPLRKPEHISPTATIVKTDTLNDFKRSSEVVVIGYFDSNDLLSQEVFHSVAEAMHEDVLFGVTLDAALAEVEEVQIPSVVVHKSFGEQEVVIRSTPDESVLKETLKEISVPLIVEFLPELHDDWMKVGIPLGYLFCSTAVQQTELLSSMKSLAKKYKHRIQFGIVDTNIFEDLIDEAHLSTKDTPAFAIRDPKKNLFYPMNNTDDSFFEKQVSTFVSAYSAGTIEPTIKSAPLPPEPNGPLVEVVALNYHLVVTENDRDVLIEYYTPWCGPCKVLLPEYEKLAAMYASDERVTIAKMDVEANDVPGGGWDIRGFPTFKLFAAGSKDAPVVYKGPRTIAGWSSFISSKGGHGVKLRLDET